MYGTVARLRIKSGHMDQIMEMTDSWDRERAPNVDGFVASYVFQLDNNPDECMLVAIFEDRETYRANAESSEQDQWYRQMREHLEDDPDWNDGEVIYSQMGARPEPTI